MPQKHLKPIERCLDALVQPCVRVPYAWVDQATDEYMTRTSRLTVAKKYLHRRLALGAQSRREIGRIAPDQRVPRRTYDHWMACLQAYDEAHASGLPGSVVLLGSDNGAATAQALMANGRFRNLRLLSLVGELSLRDSKRVIANSALFVGADGGLMHVAHTTPTPSVTLFAATEPPHLRLTPSCRSTPLHTDGGVSAIDPKDLAQTIVDSLGRR